MVRNQLPAQLINLLRWNDVPRTSKKILVHNGNISSVLNIFKYNPGETNDKFITSQ